MPSSRKTLFRLHPYMMRSTYATNCIKAGVKPNVLRYVMGHSDIKTTNEYYIIVDDEMLAEGGQTLDDYLSGRSNSTNKVSVSRDVIAEKDDRIEELRESLERVKISEKTAIEALDKQKANAAIGSRHQRARAQQMERDYQEKIRLLERELEQYRMKEKAKEKAEP